ncbi:MAG: helix-turn-helix domain-containing protein [Muricoprocola sp.]
MIDTAGIRMAQGALIAIERHQGVDDNMHQPHYHDYYELYYLEAGERIYFIEGQVFRIKAGQYIILPPFVMHRSYAGPGVEFKRIVLYFRPDQIMYSSFDKQQQGIVKAFHTDIAGSSNIHHFLTELLAEDRQGSPYLINGDNTVQKEYMNSILNTMIMTIIRKACSENAPEKQDLIGKVTDYIHHNYNQDLSLESLSQKFYVSSCHLCHEFKRYTNCTIVEYINVTRIMNAQRKIMETRKTLTEIALETGFSNLVHFNRVFKQITNMTPSEYRKNYHSVLSEAEKEWEQQRMEEWKQQEAAKAPKRRKNKHSQEQDTN